MPDATTDLDRAAARLADAYAGPGGAVAVLRDGRPVVRHAWGYADLERRVAWSSRTLAPICSITKQFTCALLLNQLGDPAALDGAVAARLPHLEAPPRASQLCDNQSGLRDYWALTVLCGAAPEGEFRPEDARALLGRTRSLQFSPGTQYSYSNTNFRLLGEILEDRLDAPLGDLLARRVFDQAGMANAVLAPDTGRQPGDAVGYEGDSQCGFVPAVNRIHWFGDAGVVASLDDVVAWEAWIDATRDDPNSLYRRLSVPRSFGDGRAASYGFGLGQFARLGVRGTEHGGALRGWRCHRLHVPAARLSVVVLLNHQADAHAAATDMLAAALGVPVPPVPSPGGSAAGWRGHHLDRSTGLLLRLDDTPGGRLSARFATTPDPLDVVDDNSASGPGVILTREGGGVVMERAADNLRVRLEPVCGPCGPGVEGVFHNAELNSTLVCQPAGGVLHGGFDGCLGRGAMRPLRPVGGDVWTLPSQRAMDAPAPGDWTLQFERDELGRVQAVVVGCWLARKIRFERARA